MALGGIATAMLVPTSQSMAGCIPEATPGNPPPGTTVSCTGATANQNAPNGYGDGTQNGLTINVQPAASLSGTDVAINVAANNTVFNLGGFIFSNNRQAILASGALTVQNLGNIAANGGFQGISAPTVNVNNQGGLTGNVAITTSTGASTVTNFTTSTPT